MFYMFKLKPKQVLRFWKWVKKIPNGCWEWQGCLTQSGYGRFQVHPKTLRAHKVAYFLFHGFFDETLHVCHRCDNRKCVNPEHLFLGTAEENVKDMLIKGRLNRNKKCKGISFRKESGKWRARIMRNYSNILIGEFDTEQEALLAREKYVKDHYCAKESSS